MHVVRQQRIKNPCRASLRNVVFLAWDRCQSFASAACRIADLQALAEVVKQLKREAAVLRMQHRAAQEQDASA